MQMVEILPATLSDAKSISELIESFSQEFISSTRENARQFFELTCPDAEREYLSNSRYIFAKAQYQGALIAFVAIRDRRHLFHLFVHKDFQRKGLGRALWLHVKKLAESVENNGEFTVKAAIKSVHFYERLGFSTESNTVEEDGVLFIPMRLHSIDL